MTEETPESPEAAPGVSGPASGEQRDPRVTRSSEARPRRERAGRDDPRATRLRADGGNPEDAFTLADRSGGSDLEFPGAEADEEEPEEPAGDEEDEVEPVELLVQLAKEGDIEPWDIDIVEVTDAFLSRLDEADLRTSGRALFYASVLLRMKSDALLEPDEPEEEEEEWDDWEPGMEAPPEAAGADPIAALEDEMDRRLERKPQRGTPETLDELVRSLRAAERDSAWKESRTYDTSSSPQGFQRGVQELDYRSGDDLRMDDEPTEADVTGTAHSEDIESVIADVEAVLERQYGEGREEVLFAEVSDAGPSTVEAFLAVLFLAHRGRLRVEQDDLFGDLWLVDA